jgi:hypothetical protein
LQNDVYNRRKGQAINLLRKLVTGGAGNENKNKIRHGNTSLMYPVSGWDHAVYIDLLE